MRVFQIHLNACILDATEEMRRWPLPLLYFSHIRFQPEPWSGSGTEEFAHPWLVHKRGWGDCDDLVIYRAAELCVRGYPAHARLVHNTSTDKYHTQVWCEWDSIIEDPALQRLGKPWLFRPDLEFSRQQLAA